MRLLRFDLILLTLNHSGTGRSFNFSNNSVPFVSSMTMTGIFRWPVSSPLCFVVSFRWFKNECVCYDSSCRPIYYIVWFYLSRCEICCDQMYANTKKCIFRMCNRHCHECIWIICSDFRYFHKYSENICIINIWNLFYEHKKYQNYKKIEFYLIVTD